MSHLDYYKFQAEARGIRGADDVKAQACSKAFIYDRIVIPWLSADKSERIADLACGHGSFLYWLREIGCQNAIGVDSSAEQVQHARSAGLSATQADVLTWLSEQAPDSIPVLFALDFIEHISKDDLMVFLKACHRVLRKSGVLILRYPNGDSPLVGLNLFNDITHVWTYTSNCLTSLSQMHGYASADFIDEGIPAIRDQRWLKVPVARLCEVVLRILLRSVSRENIKFWNSNMWAALRK